MGYYSAPSAHRIPWDRDGSRAVGVSSSDVVTMLTPTQQQTLNNENPEVSVGIPGLAVGGRFAVIFPEPMDLVAYCGSLSSAGGGWAAGPVTTSVDTTSGLDGTWVAHGPSNLPLNQVERTFIREGITPLVVDGVIAVAIEPSSNTNIGRHVRYFHLYGAPSTAHRLRLWHPTLDAEIAAAHFDWGDIRQSTSDDRLFRVKNDSGFVAHDITLSLQALTDTTPSVPGQHLLSANGVSFGSTTLLPGALGPGEISQACTLRRNTASDAHLSLWWARVVASAASWGVA